MGMADCKDCTRFLTCKYHNSRTNCPLFMHYKNTVEVVRCRDCKNWMYEYDNVGLCVTDVPDIDGVQRLDIDFCSYGERKDNATD